MRLRAPATAAAAAALAACAILLPGAGASAADPIPPLHFVTGVSGAGGPTSSVTAMAISNDGSTGYVVDGSSRILIFDTATNAVTGQSFDFAGIGVGLPVDVAVPVDRDEVDVATSAGWVIQLNPDGTLLATNGLPGTALAGLATVQGGDTVVATPAEADPTRLLRFNLGLSVSPIPFAPDTPTTPTPSSLARIAAGPGTGFDNDVLAVGTADGSGVLYVFDSAFSLSGQAFTILLPGTSSAGDVVVSPSGDQALVTAPAAKKVFLVDLDPTSAGYGTITATIDLPHLAVAAAWAPSGGRAYVVGDNGVATIDTDAGTLASDVLVDTDDAAAVISSPSGDRVWTGDAEGSGGIGMLSASAVAAPPTGAGTVGESFSDAFGAVRFDLPVTWSVQPALPAGLSLNPSTGVVSGTPSAVAAETEYTVTASSSDGDAVSVTWSLAVGAAPVPSPSPSPSTPGAGGAGAASAPAAGQGALASTGSDAVPGLAVGALLLAGGLGAWALAARRRGAPRG